MSNLPRFKTLLLSVEAGVCTITLNRPKRKNAFNQDMYTELQSALQFAQSSDDVVVAVLTGSGDYYSSGNDLSNFLSYQEDPVAGAKASAVTLENFVNAFIDFPKPLIAAVNGPALGIAMTTLGLCDIVYCSDTAKFQTPFAKLGQSPEGVSSILFPRIMGTSKANEVLFFGKTLSAEEAKFCNFVSEVFPSQDFHKQVQSLVSRYARFPPKTLKTIKALCNETKIQELKAVNKRECQLLTKMWVSEECMNAVMKFMMEAQSKRNKRSKL